MRMIDYLEKEVTLPKDTELVVNGKKFTKIIIREFGGLDEEEISKPEYRDSLVKIQEVSLTRCISGVIDEVGKVFYEDKDLPTVNDIRQLPMVVIDYLFLELRSVTMGDKVKKTVICSNDIGDRKCGKRIEPVIDLQELRDEMKDKSYGVKTVILERGILHNDTRLKKAKITPVIGEVRDILFENKIDLRDFGATNTEFLMGCIIDIDGVKVTKEMVRNMKKADRLQISEAIGNVVAFSTSREFICPFCKGDFKVELDLLDFLF